VTAKKPENKPLKYEVIISVPIPASKPRAELLKMKRFTDTLANSLATQFDGVVDGSGVGCGCIDQFVDFRYKKDADKSMGYAKKYLTQHGISDYTIRLTRISP
jgi:hypothetical protein